MIDPEKANRIPAADSTGFDSWRLPEVAAGHIVPAASEAVRRERAREAELVHRSLTARELESITLQARDEGYADGHAAGTARGHEEGYAAGLEEGRAAGRAQIERETARLKGLQKSLLSPIEEQREALDRALHALAVALASAIIEREPGTHPDVLGSLVRRAVAALPQGADNIQVHLHPDDLTLLQAEGLNEPAWQLLPDPAMTPGGCRVSTRHSLVDFTRETRLRQLLESLQSSLPEETGGRD